MSGPRSDEGEPDLEGSGGIFADINITPLTDIFLVLLIIFMVTTSAIMQSGTQTAGLEVKLPRAGSATPGDIPHDLAVAILRDGRTVVKGEVVDTPQLAALFQAAARRDPGTTVLLQADREVPHGRVVEVMDLARRNGLARLAIATRAEVP